MKMYCSYKDYGFYESKKLLLSEKILTEEQNYMINKKLYDIGILIKYNN